MLGSSLLIQVTVWKGGFGGADIQLLFMEDLDNPPWTQAQQILRSHVSEVKMFETLNEFTLFSVHLKFFFDQQPLE